ncbi:MAG TPA: S24 family peptidase [Candidatus Paceibacterota bacterium]
MCFVPSIHHRACAKKLDQYLATEPAQYFLGVQWGHEKATKKAGRQKAHPQINQDRGRQELLAIAPYPRSIKSPITLDTIQVPLLGSAPCGDPFYGEENIKEYIAVDKVKIRPGFKYFILRAEGDSMDLAGIQDGDLVLCRQQLKADTGDRVVSLLGDNVTIKIYGERVEGVRKLLPKSSNKKHTPITPDEGDIVQGIVQEVIEE